MNPWKFYDFLDGRGEERRNNLIPVWLDSLPEKAAAKIDARILYMQAITIWAEQYVSALKGWPEIFEMRVISAGSQYRPIFFYGPLRGEVTLVYGAIEKGKLPRRALDNADNNRRIVLNDRRRICEHVFGIKPIPGKLSGK
ncbi:MAG: type II toxin-antitoxin system RelE/ParE family toxin [Acidobacteria bacterium]|nr:type II toxin-antitoxin system RelE/ParE family toxin [Acidobacteriota bacterium]